jgi:hypothetical protein
MQLPAHTPTVTSNNIFYMTKICEVPETFSPSVTLMKLRKQNFLPIAITKDGNKTKVFRRSIWRIGSLGLMVIL